MLLLDLRKDLNWWYVPVIWDKDKPNICKTTASKYQDLLELDLFLDISFLNCKSFFLTKMFLTNRIKRSIHTFGFTKYSVICQSKNIWDNIPTAVWRVVDGMFCQNISNLLKHISLLFDQLRLAYGDERWW